MVAQLQAAEDATQRVWIIGHIPSGKADFAHDQSNYYDQVVQRYENTIAAQFFGHSHMDEIEIAYSDWNNQTVDTADGVVFIAPALTPNSGNPAFKMYDVDPDTFEVLDAKVFFTNISSSTFQTDPTWDIYYSTRATWGPLAGALGPYDPLKASFWHALTEVFQTNEYTAFQLYNTHLSRGAHAAPCTLACRTRTICDIRAARSENNCDATTPGLSFKRSVGEARAKEDACGGGAIRRIWWAADGHLEFQLNETARVGFKRYVV
ncbi:hypothetical protein OF83DRAFT_1160622 [Amylostereum chailletii]|nr:hypothetical protein OF83DRAFT_1160622 [Amylostereum chailletii]